MFSRPSDQTRSLKQPESEFRVEAVGPYSHSAIASLKERNSELSPDRVFLRTFKAFLRRFIG